MNKQKTVLVTLFLCLLQHMQAFTQERSDEEQIRETLTNYIEGRNGGDLERLRKAFHPTAALKFVVPDTKEVGEWSLEGYIKKLTPGQKLNCNGQIIDIRTFNDAAQATVLLTYPDIRFHDYMSLLKVNGQWLIVDKTFARKPTVGKVLMVVTSHADLGDTGRKAGLNLKEVSYVYKALEEAGYTVDFASSQGTTAQMYGHDLNDPVNAWFAQNKDAWIKLQQPFTPDKISPNDYEAIYYAGGHGAMWDFPGNTTLASIAARIYENNGIIAAICHGSIGLLNINLSNGTSLVKGKKITGFTNEEEKEIQLDEVVPVLLQTALEKKGSRFVVSENWTSNVQVDQRLITGQNAQSVEAFSTLLVKHLKENRLHHLNE